MPFPYNFTPEVAEECISRTRHLHREISLGWSVLDAARSEYNSKIKRKETSVDAESARIKDLKEELDMEDWDSALQAERELVTEKCRLIELSIAATESEFKWFEELMLSAIGEWQEEYDFLECLITDSAEVDEDAEMDAVIITDESEDEIMSEISA